MELADRGDADALMPTEIRVRCLFPVQDLGDAEPVPAECVTHFGAWLTDSTDALNSCTARSLPVSLYYDLLAGAYRLVMTCRGSSRHRCRCLESLVHVLNYARHRVYLPGRAFKTSTSWKRCRSCGGLCSELVVLPIQDLTLQRLNSVPSIFTFILHFRNDVAHGCLS